MRRRAARTTHCLRKNVAQPPKRPPLRDAGRHLYCNGGRRWTPVHLRVAALHGGGLTQRSGQPYFLLSSGLHRNATCARERLRRYLPLSFLWGIGWSVRACIRHPRDTPARHLAAQSESAAARLKDLLGQHPEALGVRLGVKTRACGRGRAGWCRVGGGCAGDVGMAGPPCVVLRDAVLCA